MCLDKTEYEEKVLSYSFLKKIEYRKNFVLDYKKNFIFYSSIYICFF